MKEKLQQFMIGRYGVDALGKFMLGASVVMLVLSMFTGRAGTIFSTLAMLLLVLCYVRMFSRDTRRRYDENIRYWNMRNKFFGFFKKQKSYMEQRKTHHIYKCPTCKQKIRVPKGKGKICITCPSCKTEFIKKS